MLGWFTDKKIVENAMTRKIKIDEKDVEVFPHNISDATLDTRVQLDKIYPYFTKDALFNLKSILKAS